MTFNPAQKRYNRAVLLLGAAYVLILFGVGTYFNNDAPRGALAYLAAILPAVPLIGIFVTMGRYIVDETDEYLRMLFVRQSLIATGDKQDGCTALASVTKKKFANVSDGTLAAAANARKASACR